MDKLVNYLLLKKTEDNVKTEANLKYLLELFKELKSKPLFDLVKKDCKEYGYHETISYENQ